MSAVLLQPTVLLVQINLERAFPRGTVGAAAVIRARVVAAASICLVPSPEGKVRAPINGLWPICFASPQKAAVVVRYRLEASFLPGGAPRVLRVRLHHGAQRHLGRRSEEVANLPHVNAHRVLRGKYRVPYGLAAGVPPRGAGPGRAVVFGDLGPLTGIRWILS